MALRIKEVIKEQGTTVQELADKMGISRVGLSQHINGNPSVEVLERIAPALNVQVSDLFEKSSDEVIGAVRIGDSTHVINSKDDIKKLAENL
mgnify:FL=1